MTTIISIIVGVFTLLLALLGIQKKQKDNLEKDVEEAKTQILKVKKEKDIIQKHDELSTKIIKEEKKEDKANDEQKTEIKEAETDEEIIDIANDIVDNFNKLPDDKTST